MVINHAPPDRYLKEVGKRSTASADSGNLLTRTDVTGDEEYVRPRGDSMAVSSSSSGLVKLGTHLDVRNVGLVRATINDAIDHAAADIRLDMRSLERIDAAGLGMLTAAHLRAERAGYRLILRYCTADIRRVLAVTHLNRVLHIDRTPLERTGAEYGDRSAELGGLTEGLSG